MQELKSQSEALTCGQGRRWLRGPEEPPLPRRDAPCHSPAFLARWPQGFRVVISFVSNNQWMACVFKNYLIDEEMGRLGTLDHVAGNARAGVQSEGRLILNPALFTPTE